MEKKKKKYEKFSINIRPETKEKISQVAQMENRSRSSMIDVACEYYYKMRTNCVS